MTNLTDKWKKGELPEGFYFVYDGAEVTIDYYLCDYWERHFDSDVQQVLSEVPSYNEYQKLLSDQLAKNEGVEINAELEAENTKLKELVKELRKALQKETPALRVENAKLKTQIFLLKGLLKEIRQQITEQVFGSPKLQLFQGTFDNELLAKINQVLGEE